MPDTLPIDAVLPDLLSSLSHSANAVLIAPPGAGKTTMVAPALLDQPWCDRTVLLLSPRRLATRAAAERMAELAGEVVGGRIGYATRMDSRHSAQTRILVLTEGIFLRRIQQDPELADVSAVLFDEVHERSLDSDFGLALALDAQSALRPDLRLIAMSATLDGGRFAALMDAPIIESVGRWHPLTLRYVGRSSARRIEDEIASAVRKALIDEPAGDVLAFLPGVREIARTQERLVGIDAVVHQLHGSLDPAQQRAALRRGSGRKVILATSIAETSLTIDGVRIVIDSGLARRARYDRAAGATVLVTERASQAAATQRSGRAARQGAGVAYRLWDAAATSGLLPYDPPEIAEADLSPMMLDCAIWGVTDPSTLRWLDAPSPAALGDARQRLVSLGALDDNGHPTSHGRNIAALPLPPRLAHMLIRGAAAGQVQTAAELAVLLTERGLGGSGVDIEDRLRRWQADSGPRAQAARGLARRWAAMVASPPPCVAEPLSVGQLILMAHPDRVSRARSGDGADWLSAGGRAFRLDPGDSLAGSPWLAVADIQGAASGARILSAAALSEAEMLAALGDQIIDRSSLDYDVAADRLSAVRERRLGAIVLARVPDSEPSDLDRAVRLMEVVRAIGLAPITMGEAATALRQRAVFAGLTGLDDAALIADAEHWLLPILHGQRGLRSLPESAVYQALLARLDWAAAQRLDALAPAALQTPAGTRHAIDYAAEGGPTVTVRVQALFGLTTHPMVGDPLQPLVLSLTSPAGRAIQTTTDLPGFWRGSWADVAREMRGRYPKHPWPDDPAAATATVRTKAADARRR